MKTPQIVRQLFWFPLRVQEIIAKYKELFTDERFKYGFAGGMVAVIIACWLALLTLLVCDAKGASLSLTNVDGSIIPPPTWADQATNSPGTGDNYFTFDLANQYVWDISDSNVYSLSTNLWALQKSTCITNVTQQPSGNVFAFESSTNLRDWEPEYFVAVVWESAVVDADGYIDTWVEYGRAFYDSHGSMAHWDYGAYEIEPPNNCIDSTVSEFFPSSGVKRFYRSVLIAGPAWDIQFNQSQFKGGTTVLNIDPSTIFTNQSCEYAYAIPDAGSVKPRDLIEIFVAFVVVVVGTAWYCHHRIKVITSHPVVKNPPPPSPPPPPPPNTITNDPSTNAPPQ